MSRAKHHPNLDLEGRAQGGYDAQIFTALKMAYRPYFWPILGTLALGFLGRALLLGNANLIGFWVDSLCPKESQICRPTPGLFHGWSSENFMHLLIAFVVLGFVFTWLYRVTFSRLSARAVSTIYDETTYRTSRFPMRFFDVSPVGRIVTRFSSDYGNVFRLFGGPLAEFLSIIFDLICMILLVGLASPYYLPVIFVFIVFNFAVYRLNRDRMRNQRRDLSASRSPSISHFSETAQGASTIRSFNREASFRERFTRLDAFYLEQKLRAVRNVLFFSWQMNTLTAILLFATGLLSWFLLQQNLISIGSIGVAFGMITLSGNTVLMLFEWLAQVEEALIGVERLNQYLLAPLEPGAALPSHARFQTPHPKQRADQSHFHPFHNERALAIDFKDLRFRYHPDLPWVLHDFSAHIRPGEKIGIIGRTGGGKSSLIQALLHLYPIEGGKILLGGEPIASSYGGPGLDLEQARRLFALIPQEPTLFRGTLRSNLDYEGLRRDEEIFEVLRQVGLSEWALPSTLQMVIEERGRNLSLGEKQLLCLARAVLQKAPILIMDEATSSIDPQSEELLVQATSHLFEGRTQILIAHRLSTLEKCDRIFWMKSGRLYREGPPHQILPEFEKSDASLPGPVLEKNDDTAETPTLTPGPERSENFGE